MTTRNNWGILFEAHRKRRGFNQDEMARKLGRTQAMVSFYESGQNLPPLSQIIDIADSLDLTGTERSTFIEEAYLAHAPDVIRCLVQDLKASVRRLEKRAEASRALDAGDTGGKAP